MHTRCLECARHDLHRIFVCPVASDIGNIASVIHEHGVPCKQHPVCRPYRLPTARYAHMATAPIVAAANDITGLIAECLSSSAS